uniref:Uncharacterized protein n=1 Tax=Anguilla anguilla TaxID=7936 RepID=A0A0E9WAL0_ANGAN
MKKATGVLHKTKLQFINNYIL